MALFIIYEFYVIFSRKHPAVSIKYILNPFATDPNAPSEEWNPFDNGF
jgi:hypothetical protein